jgi:endonuclease/exonuclease/phosphatase family metal-dependent hydrolase
MRIANWNLKRILPSEQRVFAIRERLTVIDADIWILTETHELVAPGKDFSSVMSGVPDRESKLGERWAGIWSRHPINHLPSFVSDEARCVAARIEHPNVGEIVVYATVLPWQGSEWRGIGSIDGVAYSAALSVYVRDWKRIRSEFPNALCVVAGDFNQDLAPYHYYGSKKQRELLEVGLTGVGMIALTAGANDPIDWDPLQRHACIDHICTSELPGLRVGNTIRWPETGKPDTRLSDHFGVAVDLSRG